ncbi:MAG: glutamate mutase L [Anaerolineales bacterium]|nr:glutamate mutase L [Anaerolineales bacterium]
MPASLVDADSLLAVDVGTVTTRAMFFDVVEGHYRFVASGQAPSTAAAPFRDVSEGVRWAIENLQTVTGRTFLTNEHRLIMPIQEGMGVDTFAASLSAGPAIRTAIVGLLSDVSLESVQRLARSTYTLPVEALGMNDRRRSDEQIDSLLQGNPELILIAGGTDGGATRSVQSLLELVGLACYLMPKDKRPAVLFAGNKKLAREVKSSLESLTASLHISPNLRPTLEVEDLQPAQRVLADLYAQIRRTQMAGLEELNSWAANLLVPTAYACGRIIRFLSQDSQFGILGVDIGAASTSVIAGFGGQLAMSVYPQLGLGEGMANFLRYTSMEDILRWIPLDIPAETVQAYLLTKAIYPASVPVIAEDLAIEQGLARQALHLAVKTAAKDFPSGASRPSSQLMPYFDLILGGGAALTQAPTLGQSLLMLLDAVQPVGVVAMFLDQNNLLPALGAAAGRNPLLPVQVIEAGAFLRLATVVAPVVSVKLGTQILDVRLVTADGNETRVSVKQGAMELLPLAPGQDGQLFIRPQQRADIGFGPGRAPEGGIPVTGAVLGVVIDARGRPLRFPADQVRRREIIKKWLWTLGG